MSRALSYLCYTAAGVAFFAIPPVFAILFSHPFYPFDGLWIAAFQTVALIAFGTAMNTLKNPLTVSVTSYPPALFRFCFLCSKKTQNHRERLYVTDFINRASHEQ
jgi:hypothetical protein